MRLTSHPATSIMDGSIMIRDPLILFEDGDGFELPQRWPIIHSLYSNYPLMFTVDLAFRLTTMENQFSPEYTLRYKIFSVSNPSRAG
jgi:hypothetical protein